MDDTVDANPQDGLEVVLHSRAEEFLDRFQSTNIASAPVNHNFVQIATALKSPIHLYEPPYSFCTVEMYNNVIGAAAYAMPDGLVVSSLPPSAIRKLNDQFLDHLPSPPRIIADPLGAEQLAISVSKKWGIHMAASTSWHVAQLEKLTDLNAAAPGCLRRADEGDRDLAISWGTDYEREKSTFLDVSRFMSTKLTAGDLYVWEDDVPTTIVTISGKTKIGARISSVYTPPRHRGYGYASSAVAQVCNMLLGSGCGYVVLTWRIGEPAGRLYQRLGFSVVGTQQSYVRVRKKMA